MTSQISSLGRDLRDLAELVPRRVGESPNSGILKVAASGSVSPVLHDLSLVLVACHEYLLSPGRERTGELRVPVRDDSLWSQLRGDLQLLFSHPATPRITFQFDAPADSTTPYYPPAGPHGIDNVVIFRPSLSSIAGLVQLLRAGGQPLLIVDRSLSDHSTSRLRSILATISRRYPLFTCVAIRHPNKGDCTNLPILPFVALLAGYLGNALGLPRVLVYEDFLVAAGLFDASPPSAQHPGVTRVQRQANVLLDALGLRCRIENPLANIPALEIVETLLLHSFSHKELKRLLNGTLGCCCGMCGPCLQDCAVLKSLGCLTSSVVQETPNEQYPHRAAVVRFLTAVEDASTLSAAEMFSQFPGIAYTTQLPPVDALRLARESATDLRQILLKR